MSLKAKNAMLMTNKTIHRESFGSLISPNELNKRQSLLSGTLSRLSLLSSLQLSPIEPTPYEFDYILSRKSQNLALKISNILSNSNEEDNWDFYKLIYDLHRINKLEIAEETILSGLKTGKGDQNDRKAIKSSLFIIQGIEKFHYGLWADASKSFYDFISTFSDYFEQYSEKYWIRIFELSAYLLIANYCKQLYLPINILYFLCPKAKIPDHEGFYQYTEITPYTREIDLQNLSEKQFNSQMTDLLKIFHKFLEHRVEEISCHQTEHIQVIFNIFATLAANISVKSDQILFQIERISEIISENEYIDGENINKYEEYYGSRDAFKNFKADFDEITDEEKNDALYIYPEEGTKNQFLVHLSLIPKSQNSNEVVNQRYIGYTQEKAVKMMTHRRISNRMNKVLNNVKLARKTFNIKKAVFNLSKSHSNWISQVNDGNYQLLLNLLSKNQGVREILEKAESTMHLLLNVFNSHYTIKNSFDTHFVVNHIVKLNKLLIDTRHKVAEKAIELQKQNKNEESFNPFIEIGQNQEEEKYVDAKDQDFEKEIIDTMEPLNTLREFIDLDMTQWLSVKHEKPLYVLNLSVQQQNLRQKLKWEQKYNSRDKLHKLQKMIRGIRKK